MVTGWISQVDIVGHGEVQRRLLTVLGLILNLTQCNRASYVLLGIDSGLLNCIGVDKALHDPH